MMDGAASSAEGADTGVKILGLEEHTSGRYCIYICSGSRDGDFGPFVKEMMNSALLASVCLPNWLETDVRLTRAQAAAAPVPAAGPMTAPSLK